jgi:hypothetical protein
MGNVKKLSRVYPGERGYRFKLSQKVVHKWGVFRRNFNNIGSVERELDGPVTVILVLKDRYNANESGRFTAPAPVFPCDTNKVVSEEVFSKRVVMILNCILPFSYDSIPAGILLV